MKKRKKDWMTGFRPSCFKEGEEKADEKSRIDYRAVRRGKRIRAERM